MSHMEMVDHTDTYFQRMHSSVGDKAHALKWRVAGDVADLGAGGGEVTRYLASLDDVTSVYSVDASEIAVKRIQASIADEGYADKVTVNAVVLGRDEDPFLGRKFDTIFCSALLHEVYSYLGPEPFAKFTSSLAAALKPGGRLIIRDGVAPSEGGTVQIKLPPRLKDLANRYLEEYKHGKTPRRVSGRRYIGTPQEIAEMMFTITWGEESFKREIQEKYLLSSIQDYKDLFAGKLGLRTVYTEAYIQTGYKLGFADSRISRFDGVITRDWFPDTNGIWVFQKGAKS